MKMKKSLMQIVSVVVLMAMLMSSVCVFAAYDVSHGTVGGDDKATYPFPSATDEDYTDRAVYEKGKFTIGGKDFILLDKDSQGNYFVATADTYGRYKYYADDLTSTFGAKKPLVTATKTEDVWSFDDSKAKSFITEQVSEGWTYSTTNEKSIGYWLNNGFLTDGNTTNKVNYKLPDGIQKHLVAKTWEVESVKPLRKITANDASKAIEAGTDVMKLADLRALEMPGYTTGEAKVSLLSYSEYVKYWEKLGCTMYDAVSESKNIWKNGILFRTPSLRVENDETGYVMVRGVAGIMGQAISETTKTQLGILAFRTSDGTAYASYYVRPVFWLDKDFFLKEYANISGTGEEITAEIETAKKSLLAEFASNAYAVRRKYTDDQLASLGILTLTSEGYQAVGYPTSSSLAPFGTNYYNVGTDRRKTWTLETPTSKQTPNDDYAFEFDGQKFLILDNDGNGNYFVSAYDSYGKSPVAYTTVETLSTSATADDLSFVFDYKNEGSIAYWLDNTFKNTKLPEKIAENVKTHTWEIEGVGACVEKNSGNKVDELSEIVEKYRNVDLGEKARTTGGVALISLTEYMKYRNILGHVDSSKAEANNIWTYDVLMRTPMVMVGTSSADTLDCKPAVFIYNRTSFDDSTDKTSKIARSLVTAHKNNQLRPVFWLKGDFFKSNKIDLRKAGVKVIEILSSMTKEELTSAGYSAMEYDALTGKAPCGVTVVTDVTDNDLTNVTSVTATLSNAISVSNEIEVVAIIAVYDSLGSLIEIELKEVFLPANSGTTTITLTKDNDVTYDNGTYGRVYVWDSMTNIRPYEAATPFGAK